MSKITNLAFAGGVVAIAMGTSLFVQNDAQGSGESQIAMAGNATDAVQLAGVPQSQPAVAMTASGMPADMTMPTASMLGRPSLAAARDIPEAPVRAGRMPDETALKQDASLRPQIVLPHVPESDAARQVPGCTAAAPSFTAVSAAAAMVDLTLESPCHPNARVTLHHNGMMFTQTTNAKGQVSVSVPALAEVAVFMATFANGQSLSARVEVTSLSFYDRAVLQWKGDTGLGIHALEFGADYDEPGHVWSGARGDMAAAARGRSGFLVQLGDAASPDALLAEVYTFPSGTTSRSGDVELSVETEVSILNCSRKIEAQSIQIAPSGAARAQDLVLEMPECDEYGGYLVLKNLLEDLTIAAK